MKFFYDTSLYYIIVQTNSWSNKSKWHTRQEKKKEHFFFFLSNHIMKFKGIDD